MSLCLVLPDSQFGSEDKGLHETWLKLAFEMTPDVIVHVGDLLDCKAPARWSKGTADEFALTLQAEVDAASTWLRRLRVEAPGARIIIKEGNHDLRIRTYLETKAPALASLRALNIRELLGLKELEIAWEESPFKIPGAPGWVCAHGHEGRTSQIAGMTALGLSKQLGASVVCGHTHRAGLLAESAGHSGRVSTRWGMEVGHAMDMRKASYLLTGSANWQQAYGTLETVGRRVFPELHYVLGGKVNGWIV